MAAPEVVLSGSCMCGAVSYTSSMLPTDMGNCHCLTCRKLSGSPFLTFADFLASSITWTSGPDSFKKTRYSDIAERAHCPACGSPIYMIYDHERNHIYIPVGTINEESVEGTLLKPGHHIFLDEKAGWYDLPEDQKARFGKFGGDFQKALDSCKKSE